MHAELRLGYRITVSHNAVAMLMNRACLAGLSGNRTPWRRTRPVDTPIKDIHPALSKARASGLERTPQRPRHTVNIPKKGLGTNENRTTGPLLKDPYRSRQRYFEDIKISTTDTGRPDSGISTNDHQRLRRSVLSKVQPSSNSFLAW